MKRRILAALCAIAILAGVVNPAVFASQTDVVASNGAENYGSLQAAVDAYASGVIVLHADAADVTVTKDLYLDLNGNDITGTVNVTGGTLYCMDSQTDDFTVADDNYGKLTGTIVGNVAGVPVEADCAQHGYLMVREEEGTSFHCVNLQIYAMSLRSSEVGVYYKSWFAGDEVVANAVEMFGVALSVQESPNAGNMGVTNKYSKFEDFQAGSNANSGNGTLLYDVMKEDNARLRNQSNAMMPVYGRAYIKTADGYVFGGAVSRSLKTQVEAVDTIWRTLKDNQKASILAMYERFQKVMKSWEIPNIQYSYENPGQDKPLVTLPIPVESENGEVSEDITVTLDGVTVTVPAGVLLAEGADSLELTVTPKNTSDSGLTVEQQQALIPTDVHVDGLSADNTVPLTITMEKVLPENLNMGNYTIYHVENETANEMQLLSQDTDFYAHNQYKYDLDGTVSLHMATFSEVAAVINEENKWNGTLNFEWYKENENELYIRNADQLAGFSAIVGGMAKDENDNFLITYTDSDGYEHHNDSFSGKTVTLLADIDLGDGEENNVAGKIFYPIGYWNSEGTYEKTVTAISSGFYAFEGTFDGNGNTISNFYQNTWEMKGDHDWYDATLQYYRDGMGLFGKVYGGTVKNLTVDNFISDGEIATTGVIAAYADCGAVFENISIFNCNPRVYNIGNGGIVGCAGWYSRSDENAKDNPVVFKNITVDQTNKISALWGSYDVSCGGILGQYYPDSGCGLEFENCHVAAEMDVNNDVCANYQYYWYRYSGMLIGTVRANTTEGGYTVADTTGIKVEGCTYTLGEWNEYWYCELVKNSLASYTHDHQFSRLTKIENISEISDDNGVTWTKEGNFVIPAEDNTSATCYHIFKNSEGTLYRHFHDVADETNTDIYETFDLDGNGQLDDLKEDRQCYFMPFNQVFNGLGYGVKPTYEYDGFEEVTNGTVLSAEKFVQMDDAVLTYRPGQVICLGDLFNLVDGLDETKLSKATIYAAVSPLDEDGTVSATYVMDEGDWKNGTLTFAEDSTGTAKVVITDYFYCTKTIIYLDEEEAAEKFTTNAVAEQTAYTQITLGDLLAAKDGATIGNVTAIITDPSGTETTINGTSADWTTKTIDLVKDGTWTVVIKDDDAYCAVTTVKFTVNKADIFSSKFTNDYLYRVGNATGSTVAWGTIFAVADGVTPNNLTVVVETIKGNASGVFENGKIQFSGTGVVKVIISADGAIAVELNLEVVTAVNNETKNALSATGNNVVLLNDVSGTFSVSGGYTVYGNGFTVTLPTTYQASYTAGFVGYVYMSGGNLDNVRIEGPVYPVMNIYQSQAQNSTTNKEEYFFNSILINGGNNTISNSYISGSRTAVCIRGANGVVIEDTTLSGGAVANLQIEGANTVTLRNLTTVQKDETDSYGMGVTAHGMGVMVGCGAEITIEGDLNQYNWLSYSQWKAIVGDYESYFPYFYTSSKYADYQHTRNDETYVNIAFIFATDWDTDKLIVDNQTNQSVYKKLDGVTVQGYDGGVYSVANQGTVTDEMYNAPDYEPTGFNPVAPVFGFDNTANHDDDDENNAADTYCVYNEESGIMVIGMNSDSRTLNIAGASVVKNGEVLQYTAYLNGNEVSGDEITISSEDGTKQTLTFKASSTNKGYDKDGNEISGSIEYNWSIVLEVAVLSYPAPVWNMNDTYTFDAKDSSCYYVYSSKSTGYGEAVPIFNGIKVNYYDKEGKFVELDLSGRTTLPHSDTQAIKQDFTVTLDDGSTLTMNATGSYKSGVTSLYFTNYNSKVYAYPSDLKTDSWVRPSTTGYDFNITFTYQFTDPNGLSTEKISVNWYSAKSDNVSSTVSWKNFDEDHAPSCLVAGTLIMLADGTQKPIEEITFEDELLAWDLHTGAYTATVPSLIEKHHGKARVITLHFADGTDVGVVMDHGFFDVQENNFVFIDEANVDSYVGHEFVKAGENNSYDTVKLTGYTVSTETVDYYTIQTAIYNNCIADNMFSLTSPPDGLLGWFDYFEIGEGMKYDEEKMQADIEKYGLYTYEDFAEYVTYEQFVAFNGPYLKVLVGRGVLTYEEILGLIESYVM